MGEVLPLERGVGARGLEPHRRREAGDSRRDGALPAWRGGPQEVASQRRCVLDLGCSGSHRFRDRDVRGSVTHRWQRDCAQHHVGRPCGACPEPRPMATSARRPQPDWFGRRRNAALVKLSDLFHAHCSRRHRARQRTHRRGRTRGVALRQRQPRRIGVWANRSPVRYRPLTQPASGLWLRHPLLHRRRVGTTRNSRGAQ